MSLVKVIAACYVLFGAFGLVVVSVPANRRDMFHEAGRPFVGLARHAHAYLLLILIVACGASAWFFPAHTGLLAIVVLVMVILGKLLSLTTGTRIKCLPCLIGGSSVALLVTWVLVRASP